MWEYTLALTLWTLPFQIVHFTYVVIDFPTGHGSACIFNACGTSKNLLHFNFIIVEFYPFFNKFLTSWKVLFIFFTVSLVLFISCLYSYC